MISVYFFTSLNILMGLLLGLTPFISRKNTPFGVSLPVTETTKKVVDKQKKSYFVINFSSSIVLSIVTILLNQLSNNIKEETLVYLSIVSLFIILFISIVTYVTRFKKIKEYKQSLSSQEKISQKIVVDLSFRDEKLIFPTSYLVGINLIFVLLTLVLTIANYHNIPDTVVMQWDFNMNPSRVVDKSWGTVLSLPFIQLFLTVVMAISNHSFLSAKQQIDRDNPEQSAAKNKKFRRQSSLLNFVISILTQILMTAIQLLIIFDTISPKVVMILSIIFTVLVLGITLWYSLYYGQSGDRLKNMPTTSEDKELEDSIIMDDSDDNWKLGMFYFNKEDPSFWVEKRMGVGMTFNFAKWQAWAFMIGVILVPFIIVFFTN
ncbi:DUF1648 domain-containing protein [Vagococcus fluvialis]|uniref:DUF1648 domain-containing protein n=1 Tax=Vagococcus fluvialis TaxID=2738 RepID=UPI003B5B81A3